MLCPSQFALLVASAFATNQDAYHIRNDHFDQFDNDMNGFITLDDIEIMNDYSHIWSATSQNQGAGEVLTQDEIQHHKNDFHNLWDSIVDTFRSLNRANDSVIDMEDFRMIKSDLHIAQAAMDRFENEFINAATMLGQPHDEISLTFDELDNLRNQSETEFHHRLDSAFHRLGGNANNGVPVEKLNYYTDEIALLWAVFDELMNQKNFSNPAVGKQAYENKREDMGLWSQDHATEQENAARGHLVVGRRSREENAAAIEAAREDPNWLGHNIPATPDATASIPTATVASTATVVPAVTAGAPSYGTAGASYGTPGASYGTVRNMEGEYEL